LPPYQCAGEREELFLVLGEQHHAATSCRLHGGQAEAPPTVADIERMRAPRSVTARSETHSEPLPFTNRSSFLISAIGGRRG
jgi:hypothetical protein